MELAYFSPFNPQPSGISDYSEELLPYLAAHADIDLFVDGFEPSNENLRARFECFDYQRNAAVIDKLREYDAIVYHLGNDHRYHTGIVRVMRQHPGVAVFHDFALQDFFLGQARDQADIKVYLEELEACHGRHERQRAEEHIRRGSLPPQVNSPLTFPLNARLARSSEGIIVHSEWSRQRFSRIAPTVPIDRINHHITARAAAAPLRVKNNARGVSIASFGLVTPDKGIERALRALSRLKDDHDFHYKLVGPAGNFPGLNELVRSCGLDERVSISGFVSLEEFEQLIAETDIAINLRERPVGATSGSLCRIMAAGVPAIVSNVGAFSELPDDAVVKVDHDEHAEPLLEAYLRRLIEDKTLRERIGKNARDHVLDHHRIESSAEHYANFLRRIIARRPRRQFIQTIAGELSALSIGGANSDTLFRSVAAEIALIIPASETNGDVGVTAQPAGASHDGNGSRTETKVPTKEINSSGRVPKLEGIDYKRAAIDYLSKLSPERNHHLRTKPFYNLANKPAKYRGDGMDEDMHRHFCDFANMAVTLALPAGAKILDVGCGSGWLSEYFARLGYQVKGVDISPDLIEMSRERVARVPYGVDHQTPLFCEFAVHDIELAALDEKFDLVICYDSLHHFQDERGVMRHVAAMLEVGGLLFILEGQKPDDDSRTADELRSVMREFGTLESPFSTDYLRALVSENGFAVVGDYVAVDGLFERQMLRGDSKDLTLPLRDIPTDYHYLTCMKVVEKGPATSVLDSRNPGVLLADIALRDSRPLTVAAGKLFEVPVSVTNIGDTLWLTGQTVRAGIVMPGVKIVDEFGEIISERHGHPMLPRAIVPGQTFALNLEFTAPMKPGVYSAKVDLVDQHVCWFEERRSKPLLFSFTVAGRKK
jgi:2-polyprenyl-3-methyl-5-hydroxy-6-metoxy-1,4-benzoquinol methylase/glycosyltransferase involved in cell wall biosynthesis